MLLMRALALCVSRRSNTTRAEPRGWRRCSTFRSTTVGTELVSVPSASERDGEPAGAGKAPAAWAATLFEALRVYRLERGLVG